MLNMKFGIVIVHNSGALNTVSSFTKSLRFGIVNSRALEVADRSEKLHRRGRNVLSVDLERVDGTFQ